MYLGRRKNISRWPEGGMDYVTLDAQNHRLYIPRSTHTMVVDADSGEPLVDIPGQKHNHGIALVPEAGRGFISDGDGAVVIFDLKTSAVLRVVGENDSGKFEIVQTVTTPIGAKTMDVDSEKHKVYLPTFEFEETKPGATGRPVPKPGTFMIVVVWEH